jgi:hypothetical protein
LSDLVAYFDNKMARDEVLPTGKKSHITLAAWGTLRKASSDGMDCLVITSRYVQWYKQEDFLGSFPAYLTQEAEVTFQQAIELILARSQFLQKWFHLIDNTSDMKVYMIYKS